MADTLYTINGVNLAKASANPLGAFIMRAGTSQLGGITNTITKITVPNRDGYVQAPKTRTEQVLVFNIAVPREGLEALLAVLAFTGYDTDRPTFGQIKVSTTTTQAAYYELVSAIPGGDFPNDSRAIVTATLNVPEGAWRDIATTTTTASITANPTTVTVAPGISLPIPDADIFIGGNVGTMQITDQGSGAWLKTTGAYVYASGYGIYFQGSTGRAYKATDAAPFTAVSDLGFAVDTSGGGFKMTPYFDPTTPLTRSASLQVLSTNLTGVSVQVRWKGAYVLK